MKYLEYKEHKIHGTTYFPIEFYHVTPRHPRYQMSYHWHVEFELIRILKGEFLVTIGDKEFTARPGDVLFIRDGILHGGIPTKCIYECIVFDLTAIAKNFAAVSKEMKDLFNHTLIVDSHISENGDNNHRLLLALFESMRLKRPGYEMMVIGYIYQVIGTLISEKRYTLATDSTKSSDKRILQLKNALELIEESYSSTITLDDLAKAAGMNTKYFCRFFHEMTHRTPIDYLNYFRIERACFELATSDSSITDIALNCGYNDISYFIKTFKKYKGITPKKYLRAPM